MKKFAKVALVLVAAIALVVCSVLGTLAYLKYTTTPVLNTFTVGQVKIALDEAVVNEYGEATVDAEGNARTEIGNSYKLVSGHTYKKDPTVTVAKGSEPAYVKMTVTITDMTDVKAAFGADFLPENFTNGTWDSTTWISKSITENGNTATYEFWYKDIVDARNSAVVLDALFDEFKVPANASNEALAKLSDMQISVQAYAIQADGFANADAAWAAFN